MPLNDGAINDILQFAPQGIEADDGDLLTLASYQDSKLRLRGHQPGLAQRAVENRANRQATFMAAGLAQFVANRYAPGVVDDGDLDKVEAGLSEAIQTGVFGIGQTWQNLTASRVLKRRRPGSGQSNH